MIHTESDWRPKGCQRVSRVFVCSAIELPVRACVMEDFNGPDLIGRLISCHPTSDKLAISSAANINKEHDCERLGVNVLHVAHICCTTQYKQL